MDAAVPGHSDSAPDDADGSIVIKPKRRTDAGVGVYDRGALTLYKRLRASGVGVSYEDPAETRRFEEQNSAIAVAASTIALGMVGNAAYDGLKKALGLLDQELRVRLRLLDMVQGTELDLEGTGRELADQLPTAPGATFYPDAVDVIEQPGDSLPRVREVRLSTMREIESRLEKGEAALARARELRESSRSLAEEEARRGLGHFASALNWAEDSPFEEAMHVRLDAAGRWVEQAFGCQLHREATAYSQRCPVALGHNRWGMSAGMLTVKQCSICGGDLSECEHTPGAKYKVVGGVEPLGWCRVCRSKESCEHAADEVYLAGVVAVVVKAELEEASVVARPAFPDARVTSMSLSIEDLKAQLGDEFQPGMDVACVRCAGPCAGLVKPEIERKAT